MEEAGFTQDASGSALPCPSIRVFHLRLSSEPKWLTLPTSPCLQPRGEVVRLCRWPAARINTTRPLGTASPACLCADLWALRSSLAQTEHFGAPSVKLTEQARNASNRHETRSSKPDKKRSNIDCVDNVFSVGFIHTG